MVLRPQDARRLKQQRDTIFKNTGVTLVWRHYVSSSGGVPEAGIQPSEKFTSDRKIEVIIGAPTIEEFQAGGGLIAEGDASIQMRAKPSSQDQFVWEGDTYEVVSDAIPIRLGNATWWRLIVRRSALAQ